MLLRPLEQKDFENLLLFSENEKILWRYSLTPASGEDNLHKFIEHALATRENQSGYPFVVFDKRTQKIAGCTRFYDIQKAHNKFSIGYTRYGEEFQRTGLNRNCKQLLLCYAFETLEVERVEFRADLINKKSIQAIKSIGCLEEGVLRSNCSKTSGRRDSIVLSIFKSEWKKKVKAHLETKLY